MSFKKFVLAGALAVSAIPAAASASVTLTGETGNPGWLTANIVYTPGGIGGNAGRTSQTVYAGRSRFTGHDNTTLAAVTFDAYCIDIFDYINANGTTFDVGTLATMDPTRKAALMTLLLSTASDISSQGTAAAQKRVSAAIQLAAWEIVTEQIGNPYALNTGLFQVTSGSVFDNSLGNPSAMIRAQAYLDGLGSATIPTGMRVLTLDPINPLGNQRQAFLAAVPEPSAWALLILGFGAIGGAMRRRRTLAVKFA
jgi:hypothetical protein